MKDKFMSLWCKGGGKSHEEVWGIGGIAPYILILGIR
jgi:hypothetical protein